MWSWISILSWKKEEQYLIPGLHRQVEFGAIVRAAVKLCFLSCSWTICDLGSNAPSRPHQACRSDAFLCRIRAQHRGSQPPPCFDTVAGRTGLSGLPLACPLPLSLPVSHSCRMFLLSWVPYCSHTELAGLPGLLLAARPPNRFFMCLGFPRSSWVWPVHGALVSQTTLFFFFLFFFAEKTVRENQMKNCLGNCIKSRKLKRTALKSL